MICLEWPSSHAVDPADSRNGKCAYNRPGIEQKLSQRRNASVAGAQATNINYLMDASDNNDAFTNVNLPFPFPDAIQEFSVQT